MSPAERPVRQHGDLQGGRAHTSLWNPCLRGAPFLAPQFRPRCVSLLTTPQLPLAGKGQCHRPPGLAAPVSAVGEKIRALLRLPQRRKMAEPLGQLVKPLDLNRARHPVTEL